MGQENKCRDDLFYPARFLEEVVCTQGEALVLAFAAKIQGKHDCDGGGVRRLGDGENIKPATTRHLEGNNDRIRLGSLDPTNCILNVTCFAYYLDPLNTSRK